MSAFKKWCLAAIITGVVFIAFGIVGFVSGAIPPIVTYILAGVAVVLEAIGIPLLAKPQPPA